MRPRFSTKIFGLRDKYGRQRFRWDSSSESHKLGLYRINNKSVWSKSVKKYYTGNSIIGGIALHWEHNVKNESENTELS